MLYMQGTGAYTWDVTESVVVDYESGNLIEIKDIFREDALNRLTSIISEFVQIDYKKALLEAKYSQEIQLNEDKFSDEFIRSDVWLKEMHGQDSFPMKELKEFVLDECGITFLINFGFPRLIKNIEPEGKYHFSYESLKQFIKPDSVLEKFVEEMWKR